MCKSSLLSSDTVPMLHSGFLMLPKLHAALFSWISDQGEGCGAWTVLSLPVLPQPPPLVPVAHLHLFPPSDLSPSPDCFAEMPKSSNHGLFGGFSLCPSHMNCFGFSSILEKSSKGLPHSPQQREVPGAQWHKLPKTANAFTWRNAQTI